MGNECTKRNDNSNKIRNLGKITRCAEEKRISGENRGGEEWLFGVRGDINEKKWTKRETRELNFTTMTDKVESRERINWEEKKKKRNKMSPLQCDRASSQEGEASDNLD